LGELERFDFGEKSLFLSKKYEKRRSFEKSWVSFEISRKPVRTNRFFHIVTKIVLPPKYSSNIPKLSPKPSKNYDFRDFIYFEPRRAYPRFKKHITIFTILQKSFKAKTI
tara:strand:+ start:25 stop:354 length:330 start_codon:yes stop_codon:yes gene_type:complete